MGIVKNESENIFNYVGTVSASPWTLNFGNFVMPTTGTYQVLAKIKLVSDCITTGV